MTDKANEIPIVSNDSDAQLMLAFQQGDSSAFESLLRRNYRNVLNFIYRFMGRRDIAEDLTHEVFLEGLSERFRLRAPLPFPYMALHDRQKPLPERTAAQITPDAIIG